MKGKFFVVTLLLTLTLNAQVKDSTVSIQSLAPAFLRQGDHIELATVVYNLTGREITGQVQLELTDSTNTSVDGWFINSFPNQYFTIAARQHEIKHFPIQVPFNFNAGKVSWKITARVDSATGTALGTLALYPLKREERRSLNTPVLIRKEYFIKNKEHAWTPWQNHSLVRIGDTILVRLKLHVNETIAATEFTDGLPAGCSFVHSDGTVYSRKGNQLQVRLNNGSVTFSNPQFPKGDHSINYYLVATQVGSFNMGSYEFHWSDGHKISAVPDTLVMTIEE